MKKLSVPGLVGLIFSFVGLLFYILCITVLRHTEPFLHYMFLILGALFASIGLAMVYGEWKRLRGEQVARREGTPYDAVVVSVEINFNVTMNDKHPWFITCQLQEPFSGSLNTYVSHDVFDRPQSEPGDIVRVYIKESTGEYYVDV